MTEQTPKAGDTVRVVLEGKVEASEDGGFEIGKGLSLNWITPGAGHVKSVEILAPPVTVGDKVTGVDHGFLNGTVLLEGGDDARNTVWHKRAGKWFGDDSYWAGRGPAREGILDGIKLTVLYLPAQ